MLRAPQPWHALDAAAAVQQLGSDATHGDRRKLVLAAVQILRIDIVTESTLTVNRVMDPLDGDAMARAPTPRDELWLEEARTALVRRRRRPGPDGAPGGEFVAGQAERDY